MPIKLLHLNESRLWANVMLKVLGPVFKGQTRSGILTPGNLPLKDPKRISSLERRNLPPNLPRVAAGQRAVATRQRLPAKAPNQAYQKKTLRLSPKIRVLPKKKELRLLPLNKKEEGKTTKQINEPPIRLANPEPWAMGWSMALSGAEATRFAESRRSLAQSWRPTVFWSSQGGGGACSVSVWLSRKGVCWVCCAIFSGKSKGSSGSSGWLNSKDQAVSNQPRGLQQAHHVGHLPGGVLGDGALCEEGACRTEAFTGDESRSEQR